MTQNKSRDASKPPLRIISRGCTLQDMEVAGTQDALLSLVSVIAQWKAPSNSMLGRRTTIRIYDRYYRRAIPYDETTRERCTVRKITLDGTCFFAHLQAFGVARATNALELTN